MGDQHLLLAYFLIIIVFTEIHYLVSTHNSAF